MQLARHTKANAEFFEKGCGPAMSTWADWIKRGIVRGKVIDGKPFVDLNWFAVNEVMEAPKKPENSRVTGLQLLSRSKAH